MPLNRLSASKRRLFLSPCSHEAPWQCAEGGCADSNAAPLTRDLSGTTQPSSSPNMKGGDCIPSDESNILDAACPRQVPSKELNFEALMQNQMISDDLFA